MMIFKFYDKVTRTKVTYLMKNEKKKKKLLQWSHSMEEQPLFNNLKGTTTCSQN